jgi:hypothetical protein
MFLYPEIQGPKKRSAAVRPAFSGLSRKSKEKLIQRYAKRRKSIKIFMIISP